MQESNMLDQPVPKKREKGFRLCLSLHFENKRTVQYHINWVDEHGRSHNLSNMDENHPEIEE